MSTDASNNQIKIPDLCKKHLTQLVRGAGFAESDPWRALTIVSQIALFQAASADAAVQERCGGDIATNISELGCLACLKPDAFAQIVVAGKSRELGAIKRLGESWIHAARGN